MKQAIFESPRSVFPAALHIAAAIFETLTGNLLRLAKLWLHRAQTRRQLAELNDAQLRDIGVGHAEAQNEIDKPFWSA